MSSAPPPPTPSHLLRSHSAALTCVSFSSDNERLYSGDASGLAVITSTRSLRAIASWQAHTDGLLGLEEWQDRIITHGRDNKLNVWTRIQDPTASASIRLGGSAAVPGLLPPKLCYSMDVNALNYCRFSLMRLPDNGRASGSGARDEPQALIALPNLVESSLADVWELPSRERLHAAIGKANSESAPEEILSSDGRGSSKTGLIMSLHLFATPRTSSSENVLQLLCAFENGSVALSRFNSSGKQTSVEGVGWEAIWSVKLHVESVMAMAVSKDSQLALTVSADNLIGRYDLNHYSNTNLETACTAHRTKHPGNSTIAVRNDGRVCAVGGWDGKIRLYSTKKLKSLGTLAYHKGGCQAVAFANPSATTTEAESVLKNSVLDEESDDEDDMNQDEKVTRCRWLVGGGKDHRVSVWTLMDFEA